MGVSLYYRAAGISVTRRIRKTLTLGPPSSIAVSTVSYKEHAVVSVYKTATRGPFLWLGKVKHVNKQIDYWRPDLESVDA